MRVLIVTNTYPPADISGVGTLVWELARHLAEHGHEAAVLVRRALPDDPHARLVGGPKLLFPLGAAWAWWRSSPQRWDVVHLHESDGFLVAMLLRLARRLGRPAGRPRLVATLQVSYRRERRAVRPILSDGAVVSTPAASERRFAILRAPLLAQLGRWTARLADAVVAPSQGTARELEEDYGATVDAVIPNGVALPSIGGSRDRSSGAPTVLYAGRLRTRKAVAVLLHAFSEVARHLPTARLLVLGDGEQRGALAALAGDLGLAEHVRLAGSVPRGEVSRFFADADVFCLPSVYEGMPLAILEAMAAGLPVVATDVCGNPEAVVHGVTGLLVPPQSAAALAAALLRLLGDRELRHRMGSAGQQRVANELSIERVADAYLRLWADLVARSSLP